GRVNGDAVLSRIAKVHGRSAAQICLRYLVQQDIIVIPKTSRPERLKENFAIFDFELTPAEMKEIAALADLILSAPPDDRSTVMADILANLGEFVLQKAEDAAAGQPGPRRH